MDTARRQFLGTLATGALFAQWAPAQDVPPDLRITRATSFDLVSQRSKLAGKNARLDVHGDRATDRLLRLELNSGQVGIGNCPANRRQVEQILGRNPLKFLDESESRMSGPLGVGTMPLWDLAGKLLERPVYELFGAAGPDRVPAYDGSIYFFDLLPEYAPNWQDRLKREIDMGLAAGHRAFKIKIGRGHRWMDRAAGDRRDIELVQQFRKHAGEEVVIGVDANNGYDLAGAKQFMIRAAGERIAFAEEMFPETVEDCLDFKALLRELKTETLLADGETQDKLDVFRPFMKAKAIDVYQGDMNHFGFEGILTEAGWAAEEDLLVAPHNWSSLIGYYMQLHVGRAITNFYRAEHDPLSNEWLHAEGYDLSDGWATVPDAPGFGLELSDEAWRDASRVRFDLKL